MTITIAGDFATTYRGLNAIERGNAFSEEIVALLKNSDLSIVNLESPVAEGECKPIEKVGPNLRTNRIAIKFLKESGVDVVTLANNHFFDYGEKGVIQTIECLEDNCIRYVGGGRSENEKRHILYVETDDSKVAILNYCEAEFSVRNGGGSNHIDPICVYHDIQEAKSKASFILVITHGGHEGYNLPSPRMQELYRFFIDAGANIVVNHHQHCYSGYEDYHAGKIYYGLGNFFFDEPEDADKLWVEGFILQLEIKKKYLTNSIMKPYVQCTKEHVEVRLMKDNEKEEFNNNIDALNTIICNKERLREMFIKYGKSKSTNYRTIFAPYSNRILKALCKRGLLPSFFTRKRKMIALNNVQCESHRDLLEYALSH